jgi:DNA modification methylase
MSLPVPYFQDESCTIYHGDCRELLPLVGAVDLVLTDPPYGISLQNHGRSANSYHVQNDHSQEVGQAVLDSLAHIPTIAFASPKKPWAGEWRQHLVWDKGPAVGGGGDIATCWKPCWELIQVRKNRPLNGGRDSAVLNFWTGPITNGHPTEKPVALISYLMSKASQPGDVILDPFGGSGTTGRSAKDLGRKSILVEIEERYCEIAAKRLQQSVMALEIPA